LTNLVVRVQVPPSPIKMKKRKRAIIPSGKVSLEYF